MMGSRERRNGTLVVRTSQASRKCKGCCVCEVCDPKTKLFRGLEPSLGLDRAPVASKVVSQDGKMGVTDMRLVVFSTSIGTVK